MEETQNAQSVFTEMTLFNMSLYTGVYSVHRYMFRANIERANNLEHVSNTKVKSPFKVMENTSHTIYMFLTLKVLDALAACSEEHWCPLVLVPWLECIQVENEHKD